MLVGYIMLYILEHYDEQNRFWDRHILEWCWLLLNMHNIVYIGIYIYNKHAVEFIMLYILGQDNVLNRFRGRSLKAYTVNPVDLT